MNVFEIHRQIVNDYSQYIRSFINISDPEIERTVKESLSKGRLWPQPLLQFNPAYEQVGRVEDVIASGLLHDDLRYIFKGYSLYRHQRDAIALGVPGTDCSRSAWPPPPRGTTCQEIGQPPGGRHFAWSWRLPPSRS